MRRLSYKRRSLYSIRYIRILHEEVQSNSVPVLHHPQRVQIRQSYGDEFLVGFAGARSNDARWRPKSNEVCRPLFRVPGAGSAIDGAQPEHCFAGLSKRLAPVVVRI